MKRPGAGGLARRPIIKTHFTVLVCTNAWRVGDGREGQDFDVLQGSGCVCGPGTVSQ